MEENHETVLEFTLPEKSSFVDIGLFTHSVNGTNGNNMLTEHNHFDKPLKHPKVS